MRYAAWHALVRVLFAVQRAAQRCKYWALNRRDQVDYHGP